MYLYNIFVYIYNMIYPYNTLHGRIDVLYRSLQGVRIIILAHRVERRFWRSERDCID